MNKNKTNINCLPCILLYITQTLIKWEILKNEILQVLIKKRKSSNARILDFIAKTKNPYVFKVNGRLVKISFTENGPTADEFLSKVLENLYG